MEMEVPCLSTHYAVMNAQEECVQRDLPLPVVLYHMYLKVVHSGKTLSEVLHLDDASFGQFGSESLHITCSAGITPYERDFEPCLVMNFFSGLGLTPVGTEDMVSSRCFCSSSASCDCSLCAGLAFIQRADVRTLNTYNRSDPSDLRNEHEGPGSPVFPAGPLSCYDGVA